MNKSPPLVSIVICTYNGENRIKKLLDSILRVDYPRNKLEIIVVDDGSADRTSGICERHELHPKIIRHDTNKGLAEARNTGIRNSAGEIILFTDDDTEVEPNWVKKMVKNLKNFDIAGGFVSKPENTLITKYYYWKKLNNKFIRKMGIITPENWETHADLIVGCNMGFRRSVFNDIGFFNPALGVHKNAGGGEETDIIYRACINGKKILYDPEVFIIHHHLTSISALIKRGFRYGRSFYLLQQNYGYFRKILTFLVNLKNFGTLIVGLFFISYFGLYILLPLYLFTLPLFLHYKSIYLNYENSKEWMIALVSPFFDFIQETAMELGLIFQTGKDIFR